MIEDTTKNRNINLTELELTHLYHMLNRIGGDPDDTGRGVLDNVCEQIEKMIDTDQHVAWEWRSEHMVGALWFNDVAPTLKFKD